MYESRIRSEQADLLMKAVLQLRSEEDAYRFFEDVCTIAEMKSMAQRLEVAVLLRSGVTYQEIARQTGASSATISRVNRALLYGADGYSRVLDALDGQEKHDAEPEV
ncbi:MAG: helix-turn-helix domain-containing protein [Clostridia bacterium]|nr:helix-turn-helix domain-containing protein [Clostridia bacterium]